jgi:hypothetical protein
MAAVYGSQRLSGDAVFGAQGAADGSTSYTYAVSGGFVLAGAAATSLTSGAISATTWTHTPTGGIRLAGHAASEGPPIAWGDPPLPSATWRPVRARLGAYVYWT